VKKLTYHPVADLFPLLQGAEFDELVDNIREVGQIDPILKCRGQIIDGRHRACVKLGIRPKFEEWDGKGSLTAISASRNLHPPPPVDQPAGGGWRRG
jgi:hypothetical protein